MMKFLLLLGAVLSLTSSVYGRRIEDADSEYIPIEGRMGGASRGSSCIIRQRSIDVDEDDEVGSAKQLVGGSSIYIPGALGDGASSAESGEDDADDDEVEASEEEDEEYPDYGGGMPPQMQYPVQYGGGMRPGYQQYSSAPSETALSVSSEPSFGYDQEQYSGDTYKRKRRKPSKPKKRKGGNINCIIITKGGGQKVAKKKPFKLFGWIPLSRRRRSIANHIKAFKSQ